MKKLLSIIFVSIFVFSMAMPAFAHGHRRGSGTVKATNYSVCSIKTCTISGVHNHSGKAYSSHYYGDGHNYHGYCSVSNCSLTGYHSHNGNYCFAHTSNDGHSGCRSYGHH